MKNFKYDKTRTIMGLLMVIILAVRYFLVRRSRSYGSEIGTSGENRLRRRTQWGLLKEGLFISNLLDFSFPVHTLSL